MKKFIQRAMGSLLIVAIGVASLATVASFLPTPAHAGQGFYQVPEGAIAHNDAKGYASKKIAIYPGYDYPWQFSGPFYASAVTWTSTIIQPGSLCTNLKDGVSGYQGPYRVIGFAQQAVQIIPTTLTYTAVAPITTTFTSQGMGPIILSATGLTGSAQALQYAWFDTQNIFGNLPPSVNVAVTLSSTATATSNNVVYWVLDRDW